LIFKEKKYFYSIKKKTSTPPFTSLNFLEYKGNFIVIQDKFHYELDYNKIILPCCLGNFEGWVVIVIDAGTVCFF
jgi:hypothetical protein